MKKRLLCLMASLLLCGAVSAQHFTAPDAHAKSGNTPIVAAVTVDNTAPATGAELAVYVGNELRGLATTTLEGKYWVQVFYNTGTTETLTFKLWDPTGEGTELTDYVLTYNNLTELTTSEEGYGTPSAPVVLSFATTTTQEIPIADGWTWWSTAIELSDINGLQLLENSLGTSGIRIQSMENGYVDRFDYNGNSVWFGTLQSVVNEQMYMVRSNTGFDATLTGRLASASNHPITIKNGWNWIGFPSINNVSLSTALSGFTPEANDQIKSKDSGYSTYVVYGSSAMWFGTLNTLQSGQGYMYYSNSNSNKTLTYQISRNEFTNENNSLINNSFISDDNAYAHNMTLTAIVELDGDELRSEDYELAAFVGKECRGSVKLMYVEPLNRYLAFLLISGEKEESLSFVLTDGQETSISKDRLMYLADGIIGTPTEPTMLHFGPLGIEEDGQCVVNVYPNPSKGIFNIEGNGIRKVEIINTYGQVIYSKENENNNLHIDLNNQAIGVYFLRVITDQGIVTKQLIKE